MTTHSADNITCTVDDEGLARVWLDRPDKLNGLTLPMLPSSRPPPAGCAKDRDLRAVVLTGAGESFSAGLDFAAVDARPAPDRVSFVPSLLRAPTPSRRPLGLAPGAGAGDRGGAGPLLRRRAAGRPRRGLPDLLPDAQWSVMEAKWGLIPDMSGVRSLAEVVGMDTAKLLTMTGDTLSGEQAKQIGPGHRGRRRPDGPPPRRSAERLMTRSPDALAAAKRLFNTPGSARRGAPSLGSAIEQIALLMSHNTRIAREAAFRRELPQFTSRDPLVVAGVVDGLSDLLRAARAWVADDPDPVTRAELGPAGRSRLRATADALPTWPTASPGRSSSAPPGCAAPSAPARRG